MKYLGIHKLFWMLLVLSYTLFEILVTTVVFIFRFIWCFSLDFNYLWKILHTESCPKIDVEKQEFYYEIREDKNIMETIKRRINYWDRGD